MKISKFHGNLLGTLTIELAKKRLASDFEQTVKVAAAIAHFATFAWDGMACSSLHGLLGLLCYVFWYCVLKDKNACLFDAWPQNVFVAGNSHGWQIWNSRLCDDILWDRCHLSGRACCLPPFNKTHYYYYIWCCQINAKKQRRDENNIPKSNLDNWWMERIGLDSEEMMSPKISFSTIKTRKFQLLWRCGFAIGFSL